MVRGISNPTGVSCHLSAALQLFCYSHVSLRHALIQLLIAVVAANEEEANTTTAFQQGSDDGNSCCCCSLCILVEFGKFFHSISISEEQTLRSETSTTTTHSSSAVDPTLFYSMLVKATTTTKITSMQWNPYQLGDAGTALRMILEIIRNCINESIIRVHVCQHLTKSAHSLTHIPEEQQQQQQVESTATDSTTPHAQIHTTSYNNCLVVLKQLQQLQACCCCGNNNISSSSNNSSCNFGQMMIQTLVGIQRIQQLDQEITDDDDDDPTTNPCMANVLVIRWKTKTRSIPYPFPLPQLSSTSSSGCHSIVSALLAATSQPKTMQGYNWDITKDYKEVRLAEEATMQQPLLQEAVARGTMTQSVSTVLLSSKMVVEQNQPEESSLSSSSTSAWTTYQTLHLQSLPCHSRGQNHHPHIQLLLFQLQPFSFQNGKLQHQQHESMMVPLSFEMPDEIFACNTDFETNDVDVVDDDNNSDVDGCCCWNSMRFMLQAAILHIDYSDSSSKDCLAEDEEELQRAGHYVVLIKEVESARRTRWSLVDDDQVTSIILQEDETDVDDLSALVQQLQIQQHVGIHQGVDCENVVDESSIICPTLVSYTRYVCNTCQGIQNNHYKNITDQDERMIQRGSQYFHAKSCKSKCRNTDNIAPVENVVTVKEACTVTPTNHPSDLVGRRLRIRWAKGKFYPGVVVGYDPVSGKHRVQYDDGDVRDYCLAKKTIEWQ